MKPDFPVPRIAWLRLVFGGPQAATAPTVNEWRSAFGRDLHRNECATGAPDCPGCPAGSDCLYAYLFDTRLPPGATWMQGVERVVHPMLLRAAPEPVGGPQAAGESQAATRAQATGEPQAASGSQAALEVLLFGQGIAHAARVAGALARAGAGGVGSKRDRWQLRVVQTRTGLHEAWRPFDPRDVPSWPIELVDTRAPACPPAVRIELISPARIQRQGTPIRPQALAFADLYASLLRRLSSVARFHEGIDWQADFRGLVEQARAVRLAEPRLRWQELHRYSARQQRTMRLGGIVGDMVAEGDLTPFWPHLWAGQWLHLGKATMFGLGHYAVGPAGAGKLAGAAGATRRPHDAPA